MIQSEIAGDTVVVYSGPYRGCSHELFLSDYPEPTRGNGSRQGGTCINPACQETVRDLQRGARAATRQELAAALAQYCLHLSQTAQHIRTLAVNGPCCIVRPEQLRVKLSKYEATVQLLVAQYAASNS